MGFCDIHRAHELGFMRRLDAPSLPASSMVSTRLFNRFPVAKWCQRKPHYYFGGTMNTPVNGLKFGAAFDDVKFQTEVARLGVGGYAAFQANREAQRLRSS